MVIPGFKQLSTMDAELEREIRAIGLKFRELIKSLGDKELRDILLYAAQPLVERASKLAPRSSSNHYRYGTAKVVRGIRAPNGKGFRVAEYAPGNLSRSIRTLSFRAMKRSILVGPKLNKGKGKGKFTSSARVDGYYAPFVEAGTKSQSAQRFLLNAAISTRPVVVGRLISSFENQLRRKIALLNLN